MTKDILIVNVTIRLMKFLISISVILVLTTFVSAASFGYTNDDGPILISDTTTFDNDTGSVNASEYWITNIGTLNNVNNTQFNNNAGTLSIDISWLTTEGNNLWCALTGCTMTGNINMSGNNITNVDTITANEFIGDGSGLTNLPGNTDDDFHTYFNGSAYNNIIYNLTDGDVNDVESQINPGKKFIFGEIFT